MLKPMEKKVEIFSGSIIKIKNGNQEADMEVAGFSLSVNSSDPLGMGTNAWVNDREAYNKNIAQCRADEDSFRAYARRVQDEMLAALSSGDTESVPGEDE